MWMIAGSNMDQMGTMTEGCMHQYGMKMVGRALARTMARTARGMCRCGYVIRVSVKGKRLVRQRVSDKGEGLDRSNLDE